MFMGRRGSISGWSCSARTWQSLRFLVGPWRKHHLAFLITHLGIITLLLGSLIGRIWGVEGTITLFKDEPPTNRLLVDQRQLRVHDVDGIVKGFPAEYLHHPANPQRPRNLGFLASDARLQIVDYAPAIEGKLNLKQSLMAERQRCISRCRPQ